MGHSPASAEEMVPSVTEVLSQCRKVRSLAAREQYQGNIPKRQSLHATNHTHRRGSRLLQVDPGGFVMQWFLSTFQSLDRWLATWPTEQVSS